jgi:cytochrome c-type biogenesis protein CcmH
MKLSRFARAVFLALLLAPIAVHADTAPDPKIENEAQQIFGQVMSPFCPGRLLADCPSSQAGELRDDIRAKLASGEPSEQILDGIYAVYKDDIRAVPPRYGFGMVAWLAPGLFLLLGIVLWVLWMRHQGEEPMPAAPQAPDPGTLSQIEADLKRE